MAETVTARDANQRFSQLLARAEAGEEIVITRRGKRVARIVPEGEPTGHRRLTPEQQRAAAEMERWFGRGWRSPGGDAWPGREALYDDLLTEACPPAPGA